MKISSLIVSSRVAVNRASLSFSPSEESDPLTEPSNLSSINLKLHGGGACTNSGEHEVKRGQEERRKEGGCAFFLLSPSPLPRDELTFLTLIPC